jgi:glucose-6-phosphate 1-epimerase
MESDERRPEAVLAEGRDGMPAVALRHPSGSRAQVYLHGAHLTSWVLPGGEEMIFLSQRARFEPGAAIRGGVPVIFPQFAELGPLPKHGFARTRGWELAALEADAPGGPTVRLSLRDDEATRALWPHPFSLTLAVSLGDGTLTVSLTAANTGDEPFAFTTALHSYFRVDDVRRAAVEGLEGVRFRDKVDGGRKKTETTPVLVFSGETDRVYEDVPGRVILHGAAGGHDLAVDRSGFRDVVVWNPWEELARTLDDLGGDEYLCMLCIEPACAASPVTLAPGESWQGTQVLKAG